MNINFNIFKTSGVPHTLKVFELYEESGVSIPDGAQILHTEVVGEVLEVWAAVPQTSIVASAVKNINGEVVARTAPVVAADDDEEDVIPPHRIYTEPEFDLIDEDWEEDDDDGW